MKVSVIVPAYNSADFIEDTLASVVEQSFRDFEVIVIDDGSTDRTAEKVEKWRQGEARIKYYYQENGGVSSARNKGMEKAEGEFICFLDSDDTLEPEFLEEMYRAIEEGQKDVCFCGFYYKSKGKILNRIPGNFDIGDLFTYVVTKQWISTDSWMIRRSFLRRWDIRFQEGAQYGEDFEFFCKLIYRASPSSCAKVSKYLTSYHLHPDSLSHQGTVWYPVSYIQGSLRSYKSLYNYIRQEDGGEKDRYLLLVSEKIKKFYLFNLWGTLLLSDKKSFVALREDFKTDYGLYHLNVRIKEIKFRMWEMILSCAFLRQTARLTLRPYKYWKRNLRARKVD